MKENQKIELATIGNNIRKINELKNKEEKLEDYLLDGEIDINQYKKWRGKLQQLKASMQEEINVISKETFSLKQSYQEMMNKINNVEDIFKICQFSSRMKLIRKIFQIGLSFDGAIFRTQYIHPAFMPFINHLSVKKILLFENSSSIQPTLGKEKIEIIEQELASFIVNLIGNNFIND